MPQRKKVVLPLLVGEVKPWAAAEVDVESYHGMKQPQYSRPDSGISGADLAKGACDVAAESGVGQSLE